MWPEIAPNVGRFVPFFEGAPKFWDLNCEAEATFDHAAKLHGDQPREL